ncbi:hypothetical protein GCM10007320_23190 [Pseudorhodoferax aquiterrae]|uniref:Uncharacterized protein n=1 Tax=Pseudorhodoferax aquiterrae TaxID=747304 RepID=A0ABQ3G1J6_9BURK|nr:hypothetical protein [Pseudorhodoferax aquiterrae]GHC81053.1 hypothetical protein GCM10007320_23190 [Pseudorhodoferax aquiterrae]
MKAAGPAQARQGRCATLASDRGRQRYLRWLAWAFALFSTARVAAYLPTLLAIVQSASSTQHSLWTWVTWTGANATMAAWLYEHNGQRLDKAVAVSLCNASMCLLITGAIVLYRA